MRKMALVIVCLCIACPPPPTVPVGAKICNVPGDCDYPAETCGFSGWNTVLTCIPNTVTKIPCHN